MAYQAKYYKEVEVDGHLWRLEIRQNTNEPIILTEIGPVLQQLRLVVQGDQADIDTPVVKTSLEMTFVDAPDLDDTLKCGYWEEFYTSDALEYRVILYKDGVMIWAGFVTPDSFSEELRYRGSVSIIARDNTGHLQDFIFDLPGDENGLVSLLDIVNGAWEKGVSMPVDVNMTNTRHNIWPYTDDAAEGYKKLYSAMFNVTAFDNMTWWDVLEKTLYSVGCVIRYTGTGSFILEPIRNLGLNSLSWWGDVPRRDVDFIAHGRRELAPAVKSIRETVKFEIAENVAKIEFPEDVYGDEGIMTGMNFDLLYTDMPVHAYKKGMWGGEVSARESCLLNTFAYKLKEGKSGAEWGAIHSEETVFLACGNLFARPEEKRCLTFRTRLNTDAADISITPSWPVTLYDDGKTVGNYPVVDLANNYFSFELFVNATFTRSNGKVLYYGTKDNGLTRSWLEIDPNEPISLPAPYYSGTDVWNKPFAFPTLPCEGNGLLEIKIYSPMLASGEHQSGTTGVYLRINDIQVKPAEESDTTILEGLRINTKYSETNNVVMERKPEFGNNTSKYIAPQQIKNGIFIRDQKKTFPGSEAWRWFAGNDSMPLGGLIHQQILSFYSKPNNVLTGELVSIDKNKSLQFNALYRWNGVDHLLMSGALNILTGRIEGATLREFKRYDHMWETWVINEDNDVPAMSSYLTVWLRSDKELYLDSVGNLPSWITAYGYTQDGENEGIILDIANNTTGQQRQAYIQIDSAWVRVTQSS